MSDGFIGFKALGWGAGALLAVAALAPSASSQWNPLRLAKEKSFSQKSTGEMQRPSLLKKASYNTGGSTTTAGTTTSTTTIASYPELSTIQSNFDPFSEMNTIAQAPSAGGDDVGAFRFNCQPGQIRADDPLVFPGQPGKSHLHQFFGNTGANAYSTYDSLRQTGQSTCMSPLNRSAYWIPAMLDGKGNVVRPNGVGIYYKRRPAYDPTVSDPTNKYYMGKAIPLPNGLRFIMGFNMATGQQVQGWGASDFGCNGPIVNVNGLATMAEALKNCPAGHQLRMVLHAPECWDGKNLDSADHQSHLAHASFGDWGYLRCPSTHPYVIPAFELAASYSIAAGDDTSLWRLSSDAMHPELGQGGTWHGDWFGAWDPTAQAMWTDNCINKKLNCSGGDLGNGKGMKYSWPFAAYANPRLVPLTGVPFAATPSS